MDKEKIISLTIPQWHELAQTGAVLPMRIPINGVSMYPLIRRNRDMVSITPVSETPRVGDIVLFADPHVPDRYVLHRVWQLEEGRVLTWGDNCDRPDGWLPLSCVWGRAVLIERGRRKIVPDIRKGMLLARVWHPLGYVLRRVRRVILAVLRRIKRWIIAKK